MLSNTQKQLLREKYNGEESPDFFVDCQRLDNGELLDYIIGWKPFLNCHIDLSYKPLIPRPETEFWVEKIIDKINNVETLHCNVFTKILDIFSGSGCIGIAVAKNIPNVNVDFAELDKNLIKQIKKNITINQPVGGCVYQSDIFSNLKNKKYDFIVANPPYIAKNRKNKVEKSVLKYEPSKALFAGDDGLLIIKKFLREARNYLTSQGSVWLEFDSFQKKEIEELLKKYKYNNWKFHKDQYNRWRFVVVAN